MLDAYAACEGGSSAVVAVQNKYLEEARLEKQSRCRGKHVQEEVWRGSAGWFHNPPSKKNELKMSSVRTGMFSIATANACSGTIPDSLQTEFFTKMDKSILQLPN
jgi:hypothetical protein